MPDLEHHALYVSCDNPTKCETFKSIAAGIAADVWEKGSAASTAVRGSRFDSSALFKISEHYRFALERVFQLGHSMAIFTEEDLVPAPDFLTFFRATAPLLDTDPSLFCVSAWNDNGQAAVAEDQRRMLRTGFFPGLGFMITRSFWENALRTAWPRQATTGWDHWLRVSGVVKHRECLIPEVPRVSHVSKSGANVRGKAEVALFERYAVSTLPADPALDAQPYGSLDYLAPEEYDRRLGAALARAVRVRSTSLVQDIANNRGASEYVVLFKYPEFKSLASKIGLWAREARGTHHGVIQVLMPTTLQARAGKRSVLFLAEQRDAARFLGPGEAILRSARLQPIAAQRGQNCDDACSAAGGMRCDVDQMLFVNDCDVMRGLFQCEMGCNNQAGRELPCYVEDEGQPTYHQCLISHQEMTSCKARHPSTVRACPCVGNGPANPAGAVGDAVTEVKKHGQQAASAPSPPPPPPPPDQRQDQHEPVGLGQGEGLTNAALVIVSHSRVQAVSAILTEIAKQRSDLENVVTVYISCDAPGSCEAFRAIARDTGLGGLVAQVWCMPAGFAIKEGSFHDSALSKISEHFRFALHMALADKGHSHAIMLEDDLMPAPDFVRFFRDTAPLLDRDSTLFCVSAWNDNGFASMASDPSALQRTDMFPGMGWMIKRDVWTDVLSSEWPKYATTGWDHWLRVSGVLQDRGCVMPELPRVRHMAGKGTNVKTRSQSALFQRYAVSDLPSQAGRFGDLARLELSAYRAELRNLVDRAERVSADAALRRCTSGAILVVLYRREAYSQLAKKLGLWPTQPRATFEGVFRVRHRGAVLLFAEQRDAADYLRDGESLPRHPGLAVTAANRGESCDAACARQGKACHADQLPYVNNCAALRLVFACERGCNNQIGKELPCYVVERSQPTFQQCLISYTEVAKCDAHHQATKRVCPCV